MSELILLLFNTALINNLVLSYLIGLDLQLASSRQMEVAWWVGIAVIGSMSVCLPVIFLVNQYFLLPLQLEYVNLLIFTLLIITVVVALQKCMLSIFPLYRERIGAIVPILLMNPLLLILANIYLTTVSGFFNAFLLGLFNGVGFLILLLTLTCLRERIKNTNIPAAFQDIPITLVALGIFSMGLMGLAGI